MLEDTQAHEEEGIFRVSGVKNNVNKILELIQTGKSFRGLSGLGSLDLADALKKWFREMKEPLIPMSQYNEFLSTRGDVEMLTKAIQSMPQINKNCCSLFFGYLLKISQSSKVNMMTSRNIGVVVSPSLMWEKNMNIGNTTIQCQVITEMIDNCEKLFGIPGCSWKEVKDPESGDTYYYNEETKETTWDVPEELKKAKEKKSKPSPSPSSSSNSSKAEYSGPWKEVKDPSSGDSYYYNEETKETTWDVPEEIKKFKGSAGGSAAGSSTGSGAGSGTGSKKKEKKHHRHHKHHKKLPWKSVKDSASGDTYYFNTETKETTWDKPREVEKREWKEIKDPESGDSYYYNRKTKVTTWDTPDCFKAPAPPPLHKSDSMNTLSSSPSSAAPAAPALPSSLAQPKFASFAGKPSPSKSSEENASAPPAPALPSSLLGGIKAAATANAHPLSGSSSAVLPSVGARPSPLSPSSGPPIPGRRPAPPIPVQAEIDKAQADEDAEDDEDDDDNSAPPPLPTRPGQRPQMSIPAVPSRQNNAVKEETPSSSAPARAAPPVPAVGNRPTMGGPATPLVPGRPAVVPPTPKKDDEWGNNEEEKESNKPEPSKPAAAAPPVPMMGNRPPLMGNRPAPVPNAAPIPPVVANRPPITPAAKKDDDWGNNDETEANKPEPAKPVSAAPPVPMIGNRPPMGGLPAIPPVAGRPPIAPAAPVAQFHPLQAALLSHPLRLSLQWRRKTMTGATMKMSLNCQPSHYNRHLFRCFLLPLNPPRPRGVALRVHCQMLRVPTCQ
eukprot:TRINITY_DN167_c0_g1_i1.p1 TRINITY_DN167_c0_g1~~TRINITY_DN167_c0_g1_i1.p1  ORF type:complete len:812 (+),score=313.36 TRINITY_DN167_c0_g1_i1:97-2436(+)